MSVFAKPTPAPRPRTDTSARISILYAVILVAMSVAQLFTFEEFLVYIQSLNLPLNQGFIYTLGPLIVIAEVFALPFLLRMWLSPAFRYLSMFLGWLTAAVWLFISLWLVTGGPAVDTVAFLGTIVNLMPGWWAAFMSVAFGILAAWSSWGLWPGKRLKK